ncbi:hypothetical protein NAPIS_ORF01796, partial [Vairimorpha apis BRL 01]
NLQQVETEKLRKYDLLANELDNSICANMGWYSARISDRIEAYIQSVTLKKTLESVSMETKGTKTYILSELV